MFLNDELSPRGPLAIPQASHAWMAWQIARHWGNRRFARPTPAAEVLAAGARWLAVSAAVCATEDPESATRRLVEIIGKAAGEAE